MGIFNEREIYAARHYKYNGTDDSIFCKLFWRRWWNYLIEFFPLWVAPNLMTFVGFLFEIVSFVMSFILTDGLKKELPSWACAVNALCLVIYQQLDNLDGRQARRTGTSSALGQFFDHGCDAITGVSELFKVAATFNLGCTKETFFFIFLMGVGFFATSWEEYTTHSFYLGPINGPDEGLTLLWIVQFVVAFYPKCRVIAKQKWVSICFLIMCIYTVGEILFKVIKKSLKDREIAYRAIISVIPPAISIGLSLTLYFKIPSVTESPFFIMSAGYVLQYLAQIIITAFLTKRSPFKIFDITLIALWAIQLAAIVKPEMAACECFWKGFCGITVLMMVVFDVRVICGLCKGLKLRAFSLKKKD